MCFGSKAPSIPDPIPPPPPPQEAKAPDIEAIRSNNKKKASGMSAGTSSTLLTGPSGLDPAALTTSKSSLLGQ